MRSTPVALVAAAALLGATQAGSAPKIAPSLPPLVVPTSERAALDRAAREPATEVRLAPSPAGRLGAWLVTGPYRSATFADKTKPAGPDALERAPPGVDEAQLSPRLGAPFGPALPAKNGAPSEPPKWVLASSGEGSIDIKGALKAAENDVIAYAAATLHLARGGRFYLLVGADDGLRVMIDGKPVLTRDESRPERDDDDLIALDLTEGDHAIVLKLHQRDAGWWLHVRLVDSELAPPLGGYLALPGTTADDARYLATKMSWVSLDRGVTASGYKPRLTVRFPEGAPRGVPLRVRAKLGEPLTPPVFDVDAGQAPLDASGVGELVAALPRIDSAPTDDAAYEIDVAGRTVKLPFRGVSPLLHLTLKIAEDAHVERDDSVAWLKERFTQLLSRGDADYSAQRAEEQELLEAAGAIAQGKDPYATRTGAMRRAYRSPIDGELAEMGLYVPPSYRPGSSRRWPLVVALHGLNGRPMAMIRYVFGLDDPKKDGEWEDRHTGPLPPLDAFVVAPSGHGNTMYREMGEDDIMRALDWTVARYPIDPTRVTVTGPSMGGIGAAAVAFRYPDRFAAAEPLCGYHSYFVRRDFLSHPVRPWERFLAEERSNVFWADNGYATPLFIVHGTLDMPESNSGVLIDKYEKAGFSVIHEHPVLGHNVWQPTYEGLKGVKWLLTHRRDLHPREVKMRTMRLRSAKNAWVRIEELARPDAWGEVHAIARTRTRIDAKTTGIGEVSFERDDKVVDATAPLTVSLDGAALDMGDAEPLVFHKDETGWKRGPAVHDRPWKRGDVTGPFRDVFRSPILVVYGADDPAQTRANEEVARALATIRWGITVRYPMMSDAEFFARGEPLANDRALLLVGNARANRVVRALEAEFPIRIDGDAVTVGAQRFTGKQLGAAFIRPNPKRPNRYVAVVEGVDALGTWRALSLPDLLPDFVVYDEAVAPARGQMILSAGSARAAGFFQNDWSLPATIADPLATTARPAAKSESDATPYLP